MKKIFTLFLVTSITFLSVNAQVAEGFETQAEVNSLSTNCWTLNNLAYTSVSPVAGTGSLISQTGSTAELITPLLQIPSNNLSISFSWNVVSTIGGEKKIQIFLLNGSTRTKIESFNAGTGTDSYSKVFTNTNTPGANISGTQKIIIEVSPNVSIKLDEVSMNAPYFYTSKCNNAPVAVNDNFQSLLNASFSGNVITNMVGGSDNDPDGETLSASVVAQPDASFGTLVFNANGSFTFTPGIALISGGFYTFTYQVTDNGTAPLTSNTATVSILYFASSVLPVKLTSFYGSIVNNKAQLKWSVAANETGDHFVIERSADGKLFSNSGLVLTSRKTGTESYSLNESTELTGDTYYRVKAVNKDRSIAYSKIIILKTAISTSANSITLLQNPVRSTLTFSYKATTAGEQNISIYNAAGVKVYSTKASFQKGINALSCNLDNRINPGTYVLEITNTSERTVAKLMKQ